MSKSQQYAFSIRNNDSNCHVLFKYQLNLFIICLPIHPFNKYCRMCSRVSPKFQVASESSEGLVKAQIAGPIPRVSDSLHSNKYLCDAPSPVPTLWESLALKMLSIMLGIWKMTMVN